MDRTIEYRHRQGLPKENLEVLRREDLACCHRQHDGLLLLLLSRRVTLMSVKANVAPCLQTSVFDCLLDVLRMMLTGYSYSR